MFRFSGERVRRTGIYLLGMLLLATLGTAVIVSASGDAGGDRITGCIDSRNGVLYGLRIDVDSVRCNRGDDRITWALGESVPGVGAGLAFAGSWNSDGNYIAGNIVEHNGSSYIARENVPSGIEPTVSTYWQVLALRGETGPKGDPGADGAAGKDGEDGQDGKDGARGATGMQGPPGAPGEGFNWRGTFDLSSAPYHRNDVVQFGGSAWVVVSESTNAAPDGNAAWELFVAGVTDEGEEPGNGSNGAGQFYRVSETLPGSGLGSGTMVVSCPDHAPRVIGGGYLIVDTAGEPVQPGNSAFERVRGNGPLMDPDGVDSWQVSWQQTLGPFGNDFVRVDVTCTTEVVDLD